MRQCIVPPSITRAEKQPMSASVNKTDDFRNGILLSRFLFVSSKTH
jgi:hypothetical protein